MSLHMHVHVHVHEPRKSEVGVGFLCGENHFLLGKSARIPYTYLTTLLYFTLLLDLQVGLCVLKTSVAMVNLKEAVRRRIGIVLGIDGIPESFSIPNHQKEQKLSIGRSQACQFTQYIPLRLLL